MDEEGRRNDDHQQVFRALSWDCLYGNYEITPLCHFASMPSLPDNFPPLWGSVPNPLGKLSPGKRKLTLKQIKERKLHFSNLPCGAVYISFLAEYTAQRNAPHQVQEDLVSRKPSMF